MISSFESIGSSLYTHYSLCGFACRLIKCWQGRSPCPSSTGWFLQWNLLLRGFIFHFPSEKVKLLDFYDWFHHACWRSDCDTKPVTIESFFFFLLITRKFLNKRNSEFYLSTCWHWFVRVFHRIWKNKYEILM